MLLASPGFLVLYLCDVVNIFINEKKQEQDKIGDENIFKLVNSGVFEIFFLSQTFLSCLLFGSFLLIRAKKGLDITCLCVLLFPCIYTM